LRTFNPRASAPLEINIHHLDAIALRFRLIAMKAG